jgi:hypothetical protein
VSFRSSAKKPHKSFEVFSAKDFFRELNAYKVVEELMQ